MNEPSPSLTLGKIIHVGVLFKERPQYAFLRQKEHFYEWSIEQSDLSTEIQTDLRASSIQEAIRIAKKQWKNLSFRTIICGFRYILPERDEHGMNALFHQMTSSYSKGNGVYIDEELGHNCIVHYASDEAKTIWKRLKEQNRL